MWTEDSAFVLFDCGINGSEYLKSIIEVVKEWLDLVHDCRIGLELILVFSIL